MTFQFNKTEGARLHYCYPDIEYVSYNWIFSDLYLA